LDSAQAVLDLALGFPGLTPDSVAQAEELAAAEELPLAVAGRVLVVEEPAVDWELLEVELWEPAADLAFAVRAASGYLDP